MGDQHLVQETQKLFSVGKRGEKEGGGYGSEMLSLQREEVQVAQMSSQAIGGMWASLTLEMLYFTNDDDERYSIQAHKTLLRNLTVHAAETPLGYPVYGSGPLLLCV